MTITGNGYGQDGDQSNEWYTPREFLLPIAEAVGGFDLDPASGAETSPVAKEQFTESDDGLNKRWFGKVWINPPYSPRGTIEKWVDECTRQIANPDVELILILLPANTGTSWFHDGFGQADYIFFKKTRIKFGGKDTPAPYPSVIGIFGEPPDDLKDYLSSRGMLFPVGAQHAPSTQATLPE